MFLVLKADEKPFITYGFPDFGEDITTDFYVEEFNSEFEARQWLKKQHPEEYQKGISIPS